MPALILETVRTHKALQFLSSGETTFIFWLNTRWQSFPVELAQLLENLAYASFPILKVCHPSLQWLMGMSVSSSDLLWNQNFAAMSDHLRKSKLYDKPKSHLLIHSKLWYPSLDIRVSLINPTSWQFRWI